MPTFVRCINDGLDFPANIHVLERLSKVDESCLPVEMCRHAADFILESMRIKRTPWPGRYSDYSAVLQMALNWSFLVDRRPITQWDNAAFTEFLGFISQPDCNWISRSPAGSRFNSAGQPVLTAQPINPAWRPCYRRDPDAPIVSTVMRQVRGITYGFLSYLNRIGVREQPAPAMAKSPEVPDSKGLETANFLSHEIDWLFAYLQSKCQFDVELQLCRFVLAVARFTTIPLADLSPDAQHVGLLSQFMTYPRSPEPGDPPRCSPWVFIDNPGAPLETHRPLCLQFVLILKDYVQSRGISIREALPDAYTLPENRSSKGMPTGTAQAMIRRLRGAIAEAARGDKVLPSASETALKIEQLTFSQVRRSMRALKISQMLIGEFPLTFLLEVAVRVSAAFLAVFFFLKFSGRRGIRQLSRFELVVILTLGSAAGDVTFYEDVPLLPFAALSRNRLHDETQQNMRGLDRWVAHHGSKGRNVRDPFAAKFEHLIQRALHGTAPTRRGASRPSSTRPIGNRWRYQPVFLWAR